MAIIYDYLNSMRNRVGSEGIAAEELQALAGKLEQARLSLKARRDDKSLGFFSVPKERPSAALMKKVLSGLDRQVDTLVVIGIGGSLLGAQALSAALEGLREGMGRKFKVVYAGDATDPQSVAELLEGTDWKRAAVNVISKSGDTIEPMSIFVMCRDRLARMLGKEKASSRIIATTDSEKGTLRLLADREGYATLPIPGNVGGRFSVFTEVGMLPAMAAGLDVEGLWNGAAKHDDLFWKSPVMENAALLFAGVQYLLYGKGKTVSVIMPYAKRLALLGGWFRQLWAESLGKKLDLARNTVYAGPTPVAAVGPADQHSQIQLYNEGPNDKTVTFLEVAKYAKDYRLPNRFPDVEGLAYFAGHSFGEIVGYERRATAEALAGNRRPNATLTLPDLSAVSVGGLLQLLMNACAVMGELLYVNAFDQPGVEAGKRELYKLLGRQGY